MFACPLALTGRDRQMLSAVEMTNANFCRTGLDVCPRWDIVYDQVQTAQNHLTWHSQLPIVPRVFPLTTSRKIIAIQRVEQGAEGRTHTLR